MSKKFKNIYCSVSNGVLDNTATMLCDEISSVKGIDTSKLNTNTAVPGLYGWICPKCGAVMSPYTDFCPNCTNQGSNTITFTSTTSPFIGELNK